MISDIEIDLLKPLGMVVVAGFLGLSISLMAPSSFCLMAASLKTIKIKYVYSVEEINNSMLRVPCTTQKQSKELPPP